MEILTALALERIAPGAMAGREIAQTRASIEEMMLALARATNTPLDSVRNMPLWQIIRYLKKMAKAAPK
tara:strand:+ start:469 stop:675 length:207 start_codon:yes stop_codon:yes gene_type:complete